jgi:ribosomal protein L29
MSSEERKKKLGEFRTELLRSKTMVKAGGTVENTARMGELRKTVAQMLTIENEEKLGIVKKKEAKETKKAKKKTEKKK